MLCWSINGEYVHKCSPLAPRYIYQVAKNAAVGSIRKKNLQKLFNIQTVLGKAEKAVTAELGRADDSRGGSGAA